MGRQRLERVCRYCSMRFPPDAPRYRVNYHQHYVCKANPARKTFYCPACRTSCKDHTGRRKHLASRRHLERIRDLGISLADAARMMDSAGSQPTEPPASSTLPSPSHATTTMSMTMSLLSRKAPVSVPAAKPQQPLSPPSSPPRSHSSDDVPSTPSSSPRTFDAWHALVPSLPLAPPSPDAAAAHPAAGARDRLDDPEHAAVALYLLRYQKQSSASSC